MASSRHGGGKKVDAMTMVNSYLEKRNVDKGRFEEDLVDDEIVHLIKERIQGDVEKERERNKFRERMLLEKKERERLGYTAWAEQQRINDLQKERERKIEAEREAALHDSNVRKEMREMRREERRQMEKRHAKYEKIHQSWREEDEKRAKERAMEDRRAREASWAKIDAKRALVAREREAYRLERERKDKEEELYKRIRDNRDEEKEATDHSLVSDMDRIKHNKITEKKRRDNARESTQHYDELDLTKDVRDIQLKYGFRGLADDHKREHSSRLARVEENESNTYNLKKWYTQRSLERADRQRRAINSIYS